MADQAMKFCPRCSQPLPGPGFCTRCGLAVGFDPGQTPPLDAPFAVAAADEDETHYDLPKVASTYRSPTPPPDSPSILQPVAATPPPQPPPPPTGPPPETTEDRGGPRGFVLPVIGVVCVLALIAGGVWFLTRDTDDGDDTAKTTSADGPSETPDSSDAGPDGNAKSGPLKIAVPYENQPCSGDIIVVLASSGSPSADARAIDTAAGKVKGSKYLRTDKSCKTFNQTVNGNPIYAAYIGPFDSMPEACEARVGTGVAASYVRTLSVDREQREICSCRDQASELPRLSSQSAADASYDIRLRVYDLQALLFLAGVNPANIVTGNFGPETTKMVRTFQRQQDLQRDGWVGPQTWERLLTEACP